MQHRSVFRIATALRFTVIMGAALSFVAIGCAAEEEETVLEQGQGLGEDGGGGDGGSGGDACTPTEVKQCVPERQCQCTYDRKTRNTCEAPVGKAGYNVDNSNTSCGYWVGGSDPTYYAGHVYSCSCKYEGVQKTETCTTLKSGCTNGVGCGAMGELCGKNPGSTGCTTTTGGPCPLIKPGG